MKYEAVTAKLTAKPDERGWVQAYDFKPSDVDKLKTRGQLFAVIATESHKVGVDEVLAGREVLERLHEEYYGRLENTPLVQLKKAVSRVIEEFSEWEGVQVAALVLLEDIVYLVCGGGGQINIARNGNLNKLLTSKEKEVVSASGYLKSDDIFLVGTHSFFDGFAQGFLKAALDSQDPISTVENLAPSLHSKESRGNMGLVVVKISKKPIESEIKIEEKEVILETSHKGPVTTQMSAGGFRTKILSFVKRLSEKKLYVEHNEDELGVGKRKKMSATVGMLLLLILTVSVFFGVRQKQKIESRKTYEQQLITAKHNFEESLNLLTLHPERSRELFVNARSVVLGISDQAEGDLELEELKKNIQQNEGRILGEYKVVTQ